MLKIRIRGSILFVVTFWRWPPEAWYQCYSHLWEKRNIREESRTWSGRTPWKLTKSARKPSGDLFKLHAARKECHPVLWRPSLARTESVCPKSWRRKGLIILSGRTLLKPLAQATLEKEVKQLSRARPSETQQRFYACKVSHKDRHGRWEFFFPLKQVTSCRPRK